MRSIWRHFTVVMVAMWLGAFTFYATVVVPIGGDILGNWLQGQITQRVAIFINLFSLALFAILLADLWRCRGAIRILGATVFGAATLTLLVLHNILSGCLEDGLGSTTSRLQFYQWHRAYLIVSTAQWAIALAMTSLLISEVENPQPSFDGKLSQPM